MERMKSGRNGGPPAHPNAAIPKPCPRLEIYGSIPIKFMNQLIELIANNYPGAKILPSIYGQTKTLTIHLHETQVNQNEGNTTSCYDPQHLSGHP